MSSESDSCEEPRGELDSSLGTPGSQPHRGSASALRHAREASSTPRPWASSTPGLARTLDFSATPETHVLQELDTSYRAEAPTPRPPTPAPALVGAPQPLAGPAQRALLLGAHPAAPRTPRPFRARPGPCTDPVSNPNLSQLPLRLDDASAIPALVRRRQRLDDPPANPVLVRRRPRLDDFSSVPTTLHYSQEHGGDPYPVSAILPPGASSHKPPRSSQDSASRHNPLAPWPTLDDVRESDADSMRDEMVHQGSPALQMPSLSTPLLSNPSAAVPRPMFHQVDDDNEEEFKGSPSVQMPEASAGSLVGSVPRSPDFELSAASDGGV